MRVCDGPASHEKVFGPNNSADLVPGNKAAPAIASRRASDTHRNLIFGSHIAAKRHWQDRGASHTAAQSNHAILKASAIGTETGIKCFERWVEWVQRPVFNTPLDGRWRISITPLPSVRLVISPAGL